MLSNTVAYEKAGVDEPIKSDVLSSIPSSFLSRRPVSSDGLTAIDSTQLTDSTMLFNDINPSASRMLISFGNEQLSSHASAPAVISFSPPPLTTSLRSTELEAAWSTTPLICEEENLPSLHSPMPLQSSRTCTRNADSVRSRSSACLGKSTKEDHDDSPISTCFFSSRRNVQTLPEETQTEEEADVHFTQVAEVHENSIARSTSLSQDGPFSSEEPVPLPPEAPSDNFFVFKYG